MSLIPFEKFEIQTAMVGSKIRQRLEELTEKDAWKWWLLPSLNNKNHKPFVGEINAASFKIRRIIYSRNSFLPILCGKIEGSVLRITMRMHLFVTAFLTVWFGGVLFALVSTFIPVGGADSYSSPWIVRVASMGMLLFGFCLVFFSFKSEAKKTKKILCDAFL